MNEKEMKLVKKIISEMQEEYQKYINTGMMVANSNGYPVQFVRVDRLTHWMHVLGDISLDS